ncbi:unnamed protein product [Diatraea saccharalis]|uniref:Uncharacterized protein n=1 Tax=Diatraea saccharalis TaxID=40085 RepID=A0A9N9RF10_9NEOP|nr:unnamed protein product [Diatraea saccharalis]
MSDRRSLVSIASGIYEEIPELPPSELYCPMSRDAPTSRPRPLPVLEEPTYESVVECVYATVRRARPPPLPPRHTCGSRVGSSFSCKCASAAGAGLGGSVVGVVGAVGGGGGGVTRHGSLGSLPRCCARPPQGKPRTFSVFRKRLKSDSRVACSPKSDTSKDSKDVETKKKKFDFTPTRDIFKSFKVSRKMRGLKIGKGEAKSCEFLDETSHVDTTATTARCSKSVECLEDEFDDFDADLSIEFNDDAITTLALPQEIVDLIMREQFKIRLKDTPESDYLPMSPIVPPPPIDHQYMVMSPRTNIA